MLIEQLKQTPKWSEFEKWWYYMYEQNIVYHFYDWCAFPFEFQEGVFMKFIITNSKSVVSFTESYWNLYSTEENGFVWNQDFDTFEELILWYFNN